MPPAELITACLGREAGSWDEFVRRYADLVYSVAVRSGLSAEDQEEAFQETIVALYRQLPRLREKEKLVSWIIGIARRQAVNRIRLRAREGRLGPSSDRQSPPELEIEDTVFWPDEERVSLERAQQAREALEALPERCRRLIEYFFFEDPTPDYQEISRREGMPVGSIGPTRARCIDGLRRFFSQRGWLE